MFEDPADRRHPALDGIRGAALLLVLAGHFGAYRRLHALFPGTTVFQTWLGVDIFFQLSGFLLGGILLANRDSRRYFGTFYARRAFRILPLYALLLVAFYGLLWTGVFRAVPGNFQLFREGLAPLWSYPFFLQNLFRTAPTPSPGWLSVTWSLAVEEQFYLLLPAIIRWTPRALLPAALLALSALAPFCRLAMPPGHGGYMQLGGHLDALFGGVLGAWAWQRWRSRLRPPVLRAVLLGAGLPGAALVAWLQAWRLSQNPLLIAAIGALLMLACSATREAHLLSWAPLRWLGTRSYAIYLFHPIAKHVVFAVFLQRDIPSHRGAVAVSLFVSFALAELSWRLLERPMIRLGRRRGYGLHPDGEPVQ